MNVEYSKLVSIFGSKLKADEMLYLLSGMKPVVRQLFFPSEIFLVESFCLQNKLFFVRSRFKILLSKSEEKFSNRGELIPFNDPREGAFVLYISPVEQKVYLSALAEQQENDKLLGELLGYPKCCVDYFLANFNVNNTNPELVDGLEFKNKDSWLLDISHRFEDIALLSHFPCSWNCLESIFISQKRLSLLKEKNLMRFEEIKQKLLSSSK